MGRRSTRSLILAVARGLLPVAPAVRAAERRLPATAVARHAEAFVGTPVPATEIDGQQWQFAVPTAAPTNVGGPYANTVRVKLRPLAVEQPSAPAAKGTR